MATTRSRRTSHRPTARTAALRAIQALLRDGTRRATTLGYGPRFLHSTGQLHKGGHALGLLPAAGRGPSATDLPIPGRDETFGVLIEAQALGDFERRSRAHGLPVLCGSTSRDDPDAGLAELAAAPSRGARLTDPDPTRED